MLTSDNQVGAYHQFLSPEVKSAMQLASILSPALYACLYCQVLLSSAIHLDAIITSFSVLTGD